MNFFGGNGPSKPKGYDKMVKQMQDMGFDKKDCEGALKANNFHIDEAVLYLYDRQNKQGTRTPQNQQIQQ
jgi:hypothetical protein